MNEKIKVQDDNNKEIENIKELYNIAKENELLRDSINKLTEEQKLEYIKKLGKNIYTSADNIKKIKN